MVFSITPQTVNYPVFNKNSTKNTNNVAKGKIDPNSQSYKNQDKSTVLSFRDRLTNAINQAASDDEKSENILNGLAKPSTGGLVLGGLPDISNPKSAERLARVNQLFENEQQSFEKQKTELINQERDAGKSAQEPLDDIISLYDSQSDLFKTGIGWDGNVFAFDASSPAGYERAQSYTTDLGASDSYGI